MKRAILQTILVVLLCIVLVSPTVSVSASDVDADSPTISFEQQDLDGDGRPDRAILMVSQADRRYRVLVYDQGLDMEWSDDWRLATDYVNDVWLFQTETGDQARLIIRFSHDSAGYTAELFDDVNGDLAVSYKTHDPTQIDVTESPFPTLRVIAQQPWILPDGNINQNVRITAYRPVFAIRDDFDFLPRDGRPTVELDSVDNDADGFADYQAMWDFSEADPKAYGFPRASIYAIFGKQPLPLATNYLLWPYLGLADPGAPQANWRDPKDLFWGPILVDWQQGRIRGLVPFLPRSGADGDWNFLSMIPVVKQKINELNWEQFAGYYFAGSSTPDMLVRLIRGNPWQAVRVGSNLLHQQKAAFSWHQDHLGTLTWEYKLEVAGLQELPSTVVDFKDFAVREVPYEDLLPEYAARQWAYGTFVAAESRPYASSTGMWEWGTLDGVTININDQLNGPIPGAARELIDYLLGRRDSFPTHFYTQIREGFRGEFGELHGPAQLYFSPVDRKLHLLKASTGVWNLGPVDEIRYKNLDGDSYVDQWMYNHVVTGTHPITVTKQLLEADTHLIYSGNNTVVIKQANVTPSLFETAPPRNREEWETLGNQLAAQKPEFAPDDFLTQLRQFDGPEMQIHGAHVMEYRPISKVDFRFVLELIPEYRVSGPDLLGLDGLAPGKYIFENRNGAFYSSELTPPSLEIKLAPVGLFQGAVAQFQTSRIAFEVVNNGRQDASLVIVTCEATDESGVRTTIGEQEISIASGVAEKISFDWAPDSPGTHTIAIRAAALDADGEGTLAQAERADTVWVDSAPSTSFHDGVSAFGLVPVTPMLMFLGSLLFVSGVFLVYWWRVRQTA